MAPPSSHRYAKRVAAFITSALVLVWVQFASIHGFQTPPRGVCTRSLSPPVYFATSPPWPTTSIVILSAGADHDENDDTNENETTMNHPLQESTNTTSLFSKDQDSALIDAVPKYTVSAETDRPATFWAQLSASTPELSVLSPEQLQDRYSELSSMHKNGSNTNNRTANQQQQQQYSNLVAVGPQPPVIDQWSWSEDQTKVMGRIEGSNVWFSVAARGWLADDPLVDSSTIEMDDYTMPTRGGWVIAAGGVVYELGIPAPEPVAAAPKSIATTEESVISAIQNTESFSPGLLPALVAVAAAATVGFAAGSSSYFVQPASNTRIIVVNAQNVNGNRLIPQQQQSTTTTATTQTDMVTTKYTDQTIAQQRVLQERRISGKELQILNQEEKITRIQSKIRLDKALLEQDKIGLDKLRMIEDIRGSDVYVIDLELGSTRTTPVNPGDPTIAQVRAQQERAVKGRELQIVREEERIAQTESKLRVARALLDKDQQGLEKIKELEREKGGEAIVRGQIL